MKNTKNKELEYIKEEWKHTKKIWSSKTRMEKAEVYTIVILNMFMLVIPIGAMLWWMDKLTILFTPTPSEVMFWGTVLLIITEYFFKTLSSSVKSTRDIVLSKSKKK